MILEKLENLFKQYNFYGKEGSLQFWKSTVACNGCYLTVKDRPFRSTRKHRGLVSYKKSCLELGPCFVGPETMIDDPYLFACLAAQTGVADQRTYHDPNQIMGQLVVPVYDGVGCNEVFVGVIELVIVVPGEESYASDFNQIHQLLKEENLATKPDIGMLD